MNRRLRKDYYYRLAKKEGFRSRAAYKLIQIQEKYRFIKRGDVVVDLGAAPGGWLQVSRKIVGEDGFVLGVDVKPIKPLEYENVKTLIADIKNSETIKLIIGMLPEKADVVLSDLAPNVSGIWELDHARQIDLAEKALKIASKILKIGGTFLVKLFQGDMTNNYISEARKLFSKVKLIKPKASRARSAEIYLLCIGFRGLKANVYMT